MKYSKRPIPLSFRHDQHRRQSLHGGFALYGGSLVYVLCDDVSDGDYDDADYEEYGESAGINHGGLTLRDISGKKFQIEEDDPLLSLNGIRFGFVNSTEGAAYLVQPTYRQFKQTVLYNNLRILQPLGSPATPRIVTPFSSDFYFQEMIDGKYPSFQSAYTKLQSHLCVAFARDWALFRTKRGTIVLLNGPVPVGTVCREGVTLCPSYSLYKTRLEKDYGLHVTESKEG